MAVKFSSLFDLHEEIGRGAFSIVKKGVNKKTKCVYAIKIFNTTKLSARDLQKLERESRICRKLSHHNIVQLFETMDEKNYHYMIFELITGGELFDDIVARECYSEQDASKIMQQILLGVKYCHSMDIIHRDLKPENLLLSNKTLQASIKIADFGLAVESNGDELSWFGFAGTPGYLAPEVVKKVPYGKKIDVWACGIIMYILLVGYCPFWDDNNHKLYQQIKEFPVVFDGFEWESVSTEAKNLILLMLEKDPNSRISAEKALDHPWITNRVNIAKSVHRQTTLATIRKFNARRKLKGAILSTMLSNSLIPKITGLRINNDNQSPSSSEINMILNESNAVSSVASESNVDSATIGNKEKITSLKEEIVMSTENFLAACECGDSGLYGEFCNNNLTLFLPNVAGCLIKGSSIQNFYFNNNKYHVTKSSMISPNIILLSNTSAVIAYVRLYQSLTNDGNIKILQFEETIVWQKVHEKWQVVHIHRSHNNNNNITNKDQNYII